VLFLTEKV